VKRLATFLFLAALFGFVAMVTFGVPPIVETYLPGIAKLLANARPQRPGPRQRSPEGPIPVLIVAAKLADLPVTQDAIGTVQALNTVTVRPQIDGILSELSFKDGQDVKKGDVIARLDPATYKAQYDQTLAKKAQDDAQLANARVDLQRYEKLAQSEYGSRQQADTQKATVAQLEAQLRVDQAQIDNAKAYLDYTTIRAPIDGRTGIRLVDQGNIIHAADPGGIVVLTQVKPISVLFNMPQQQLTAIHRAMAQNDLSVDALDSDNKTRLDRGIVEVLDNQIDQATGTIRIKARFPNEDLQLWPGQFVNVRLFIDVMKQVVVVPTAAVQRGPNGPYVYVVDADNIAHLTSVTIARQDETNSVIGKGIDAGANVVTTGFVRLTDGSAVSAGGPDATVPPTVQSSHEKRPDRPRGGRRQDAADPSNRPAEAGASRPPRPETQTAPPGERTSAVPRQGGSEARVEPPRPAKTP
jgi:multidrug efflux system membrane fusion protein